MCGQKNLNDYVSMIIEVLYMEKRISNNLFRKRLSETHHDHIKALQQYRGMNHKIEFQCDRGHKWYARPSNVIHRKSGCPYCSYGSSGRRHSQQWFNQRAKNQNFKVLSKYKGASKKVKMMCPRGHIWWTEATHIIEGHGCPYCNHSGHKLGQQYVQKELLRRGYQLLSIYRGEDYPIKVECPHHHIWLVSKAESLLCSHETCPYCNGSKKMPNRDFKQLLNKKFHGRIVNLEKYKGSNVKILFKCFKGHQWKENPSAILKGKGCPYCDDNRKLNQEQFKKKLKRVHHGYLKAISKYKGCSAHVLFQCKRGHVFSNVADYVLRGVGCPYCHLVKGEFCVQHYLNQLGFKETKTKYSKRIPNHYYVHAYILHHKKRKIDAPKRLYVDFLLNYNNHLIAIEFNGKEHYIPIKFWGGKKTLKMIQKNDKRTQRYCQSHHIKLIYINNTKNYPYGPRMFRLVNTTLKSRLLPYLKTLNNKNLQ